MTELTASPHDLLRRGLVSLDPARVMEVVDSLQLQGAKLTAVVAVPLRNLQKKRDVENFASSAPIDAVSGLLEVLSMGAMDRIVELLGDHAETPTYEQLSTAVDALRQEEGVTSNDLIAVLAYAAGHEFPAAGHCRRLLSETPDLRLADLEVTVGQSSLLSPKVQDEAVKEQRRLRREEEKAKKAAKAAKPAPRVTKKDKKKATTLVTPTATVAGPTPMPLSRREVLLTPREAETLSLAHPLAGWVVECEVPFDDVDPTAPDQHAKRRPAVVLAGSVDELLVRGLYSHDRSGRQLFGAWKRVGLDRPSYIGDDRITVASLDVVKISELTTPEWNGLF